MTDQLTNKDFFCVFAVSKNKQRAEEIKTISTIKEPRRSHPSRITALFPQAEDQDHAYSQNLETKKDIHTYLKIEVHQ